jgi:hypothetical protein
MYPAGVSPRSSGYSSRDSIELGEPINAWRVPAATLEGVNGAIHNA